MSDDLFFVVTRKIFGGPLIGDFLFGQYAKDTESRYFPQEFPENEICWISKNVCRFPKVFGYREWIVEEELKMLLDAECDVKWRPVRIAEPFEFPWDGKDGFEIFEGLHEIQYAECFAQGKSEHECDNLISTDPGLAYLEFVKRYPAKIFETNIDYFEMIAANASYLCKVNRYPDRVAVSHAYGSPVFSALSDKSDEFFSLSALNRFGIISTGPDSYAATSSVIAILRPYLEPEFYDVLAIEKSLLIDLN